MLSQQVCRSYTDCSESLVQLLSRASLLVGVARLPNSSDGTSISTWRLFVQLVAIFGGGAGP